MRSGIRLRITAVATAVVLVVLVAVAVALVRSQQAVLTNNLDETLAVRSDDLARKLSDGDLADPLVVGIDDDSVAQVVGPGGAVSAASDNVADIGPLPPPPPGDTRQLTTRRLIDGEPRYRLVSTREGEFVVHVGAPLDDIDETLAALRRMLALAIPIVVAVLAAMIWLLVGRTLRPVESIRAEVAEISGGNLDRRVVAPSTDDEISRLAHTMNAMLDRIEASAERQRRFVADASHELRSPLTRIRTELEVDLAHPTTADLTATHRSVLDETEGMQRLVEDLLVLARHDESIDIATDSSAFELLDLDDIVLRETQRVSTTTTVRIDSHAVSAAQIAGNESQLERLVRNLLDNATHHASTTMSVSLVEIGSSAVLTVSDDGPGIPADQRRIVFERFTRLDSSRTARDGGTGLGLSIALVIAERHGGSIVVDPDHTPGARLVVELPLAPEP
jgi:signal transduction histidine kinase